MESYEKMEQDMCEFKKYIKMTNDLLCDSTKIVCVSAILTTLSKSFIIVFFDYFFMLFD